MAAAGLLLSSAAEAGGWFLTLRQGEGDLFLSLSGEYHGGGDALHGDLLKE